MSCSTVATMNDTMEVVNTTRTLLFENDSRIADLRISESPTADPGHTLPPSSISGLPRNSTREPSDSRDAPERPDVLWCLELKQDGKSNRTFFQDKPWKGINNGLPNTDPDEDLDSSAVLTYTVVANAIDITGQESNTSTTWRQRPANFEFGRDAVLLRSYHPTLKIHSKKVVKLINAALPYYPYRTRTSDGVFTATLSETFPPIMHCYQELKHYFRSYLRTLAPDQRVNTRLDIGNCGDIKLIELLPACFDPDEIQNVIGPCDAATAHDLAVLLRFLAGMYRTKVVPTLTSIYFDKIHMAAYNNLWILFKPGTVVYVKQSAFLERPHPRDDNFVPRPSRSRVLLAPSGDDSYSACVVAQATYVDMYSMPSSTEVPSVPERLELRLWSIGWTGTAFQRIAHDAYIGRYEGSRPLASLTVIPAYIYDKADHGALRGKLESRGRKYVKMLGNLAAHRLYSHKNTGYIGQIIVDPEAYRQHVGSEGNGYLPSPYGFQAPVVPPPSRIDDGDDGNQFAGLVDVVPSQIDTFERSKELCLLLPCRTEGFALRTKKWMVFEVEGISDEAPTHLHDQLESELVLVRDDDKDSLRTVLPKGQRSQSLASDFVEGKGEGKIFLLYGGPGTGKTLTVECVANDTRRPLVRITAQDVGLAHGIESNLRTWFMLAAKWHAILLIDEADLFLEQRRAGDLERNSLSTVFLRTMEYYEGVLFLTTNRPGHIDDSFISRITCPIYYPSLSNETKSRIVEKFVKRFQNTDTILIEDRAVTYLLEPENCQNLNGRELRNVLQNAVAAAEYAMQEVHRPKSEAGRVEPKKLIEVKTRHVKAAVQRQRGFQIYLQELRGKSTDARARGKHDWL
jgi:hypothetical protein